MAKTYRVILFDQSDWGYVGYNRNDAVNSVMKIIPYAQLITDTYNMLIFDIDKFNPRGLIGEVIYDAIYEVNSDEIRYIE